MMRSILIAGEDAGRRGRLASGLLSAGYRVIEAESGYRTLDLLRRRPNIILALIELDMSDISGLDFIATIRTSGIKAALIVLVNNENDKRLRDAIDAGANDFLVYPVSPLRLAVSIGNLLQRYILERKVHFLRRYDADHLSFRHFMVKSEAMQRLIREAEKAARNAGALLIIGEIGTGREALARVIHHESEAGKGPFVHIRCSHQLDETFSPARWHDELAGKIAEAQGGALLLSNVDVLDITLQSQLLQALEQHGSAVKSSPAAAFRLMATASMHLGELVRESSFLAGLLKKLTDVELKVPPLRSRRDDIPGIAEHILTRIITETGRSRINGISGGAMALLQQYDWPGNFPEFENIMYRAVLLSEGPLLSVHDFPRFAPHNDGKDDEATSAQVFFDVSGHIRPLAVIEKNAIAEAMKRYRGKASEVARRLRIGRSTLYRKLEDYGFVEKN